MTEVRTLNGQDIGQAERATRALLDRLLADTGTSFVEWVALNLLAKGGGRLPADSLVATVVGGLRVDGATAAAAADSLVDAGLCRRSGDAVELTDAGRARYEQIAAGIASISARLYGQLPVADLATAHRVLAIVTERATAELDTAR